MSASEHPGGAGASACRERQHAPRRPPRLQAGITADGRLLITDGRGGWLSAGETIDVEAWR